MQHYKLNMIQLFVFTYTSYANYSTEYFTEHQTQPSYLGWKQQNLDETQQQKEKS